MNIVPDWVLVALQTLPFLVTFLALRSLLFKPLLAYLDERREAIDGAKAEAERLRVRLAEARAVWEQRLAEARAEGAEHRARIVAEAGAQRRALLDQARADAQRQVEAALVQIGRARVEAAARIEAESAPLAARIAERVLDRPLAQA